jgi:hypothetical protein
MCLRDEKGLREKRTGLCCQLASANPGTVNSAVPVPVKSTGVQLILVLPQDEKS